MTSEPPQLVYDLVHAHEVDQAFKLEESGFPADEAATLDKLRYRQSNAPELFLGAYTWRPPSQRRLVAFVCGTATKDASLSHDSMDQHEPAGPHAAIHSVVVASALQGQGVAKALLQEYLKRLRAHPQYSSAVLISHDNLVPLYQKAGFQLRGKSEVVHGSLPWFELAADVSSSSSPQQQEQQQQQQQQQQQSSTVLSPGKPFSTFNKAALVDGAGLNRHALYCPRGACKCLLLKPGAALWVERTTAPLLEPVAKPTPCPPDFPPEMDASPTMIGYWSARPMSALTFENVGFSKSLGTIKFLTCADCDCGPLGWHDTQGADLASDVEKSLQEGEEKSGSGTTREFLLDAQRVRYA